MNNLTSYKEAIRTNPIIENNIDSYLLPRPNFHKTISSIMGIYPASLEKSISYNYFQIEFSPETYGVLAKKAVVSNPNNNKDNINIGGTITNYAFGSSFIKEILTRVKSKYFLGSINQMCGIVSLAVGGAILQIPVLNLLTYWQELNSEVSRPGHTILLADGGQYDDGGTTVLLSKKIKNFFILISAGEILNPSEGKYPKELTDPFGKNSSKQQRNSEPVLYPNEFELTALSIYESPTGIYTKKYLTLEAPINGVTLYKVNINLWIKELNPIPKEIVPLIPLIPNFPYNIIQSTSLLPIQANCYLYSMQYITANYIGPLVRRIKREC